MANDDESITDYQLEGRGGGVKPNDDEKFSNVVIFIIV